MKALIALVAIGGGLFVLPLVHAPRGNAQDYSDRMDLARPTGNLVRLDHPSSEVVTVKVGDTIEVTNGKDKRIGYGCKGGIRQLAVANTKIGTVAYFAVEKEGEAWLLVAYEDGWGREVGAMQKLNVVKNQVSNVDYAVDHSPSRFEAWPAPASVGGLPIATGECR